METQTETNAIAVQTGAQNKEPQKYLSHKTNNPNKNRCFYFTNPVGEITKSFLDEADHLKITEKYIERQACKKTITDSLDKLLRNRQITNDQHDEITDKAMDLMEEQFKEDRNKELLNPAWIAYREENAKSTTGRVKNKANDATAELKVIIKENEDLKAKVAEQAEMIEKLMAMLEAKKPKVVKKKAVLSEPPKQELSEED